MQREHDIVFTRHALQRLRKRRITQEMVIRTIRSPDRKAREADGDTKFIKDIDQRRVHVISHYLDDQHKWLVVSAWVRGEDDPTPLWKTLLMFMFPLRLLRKRR